VDERRIWVDGELVPWNEARLHVLSQSAQRGSMVFDVASCHWLPEGPAVFGLREHAQRFLDSAGLSCMRLRLDLDQLESAIGEAVRANPGAQTVKLSAYFPGVSLDVLPRETHASVAIAAFSLEDLYPGAKKPGVRPAALQVADPRKMPGWVMSPQAKLAAGYLYTSVAKARAREEGFDDILLLDERGDLAESSTQSFFLVQDGIVLTAPTDTVLRGVTRAVVLDLAKDEGIELREAAMPAAALASADEAFLTGTTIDVWPVARIDERIFPEPVPGPTSARLRDRLRRLLDGADPVFSPRWLQKLP
jgi:branched-chain amino acid aminotransferase